MNNVWNEYVDVGCKGILNFLNVLKLFSFNDAGLWTSGKKMDSWEFTTVPEHYVFDGKLIIYKYQYIIHQYINTLSNDISDDHITMPRK